MTISWIEVEFTNEEISFLSVLLAYIFGVNDTKNSNKPYSRLNRKYIEISEKLNENKTIYTDKEFKDLKRVINKYLKKSYNDLNKGIEFSIGLQWIIIMNKKIVESILNKFDDSQLHWLSSSIFTK